MTSYLLVCEVSDHRSVIDRNAMENDALEDNFNESEQIHSLKDLNVI